MLVRNLGVVPQMCFLSLLHISHPVTSSLPSVTELFVRKDKITVQIVYVSYSSARNVSPVPLKSGKLQKTVND